MATRDVTVKQLPEISNMRQAHTFLREIYSAMESDRPRMVLDCSNLRLLNKPVLHLLLECLEEAMKRNGDVKLSALPPGGESILDRTGASRIFSIYGTTAEAVTSFRLLPSRTISTPAVPAGSKRKPG